MFIGMEGAKRDGVRDTRIGKIVELAPPERLMAELPLGAERAKAVIRGREEVRRVLKGEDSRRWHTGVGGGAWISFLRRENTISVAAARSQGQTRVYGSLGFAF